VTRQNRTIWSRPDKPSVSLGSSGPVRVDQSTPDPDFKPRPVGFTATLEPAEQAPLVWDGDDA
jgi:hypothetical protein